MRVELKTFENLNRSMYIIYPSGDRLSCYENTMITIVREDDTDELMKILSEDKDFEKLVDSQRFVMLFPNPINQTWNWKLDETLIDDLGDINKLIDEFNYQPDMMDRGIYHNMHNARYFIGVGTGASMIHTLAACNPTNVAGIFTMDGEMSDKAVSMSKKSSVPAILWNDSQETGDYFKKVNETNAGDHGFYYNTINDAKMVYEAKKAESSICPETIQYAWEHLFSKVCRSNSSIYGDVGPRTVRDDYKFIVHENDTQLGDNNSMEHTWFEYIPESVKINTGEKVPLLVFNHGGGDTPGNICNSIKLQLVAEKEGFILVYPWSSAKWGWNHDMVDDQWDDVAYLNALIKYMKKKYTIDETRVYMGGFSNGSAMSQVFAMTNPEIVAAVFANNTRFCQNRNTKPFAIAGMKKMQYDYRMPVWYMYGTRDVEYPVVRGSGQQVQYDFWKSYNHIICKETPYICDAAIGGAGVTGDQVEEYYPNPRYPERKFITHRFYTNDEKKYNFYNYTLVEGKGHDSLPEEGGLGWDYIKQFRRMSDGSTELI